MKSLVRGAVHGLSFTNNVQPTATMRLRNSICHKFDRLVNDEIAAGQHFDYLKVDALKNQIITPEAKRVFGYAVDQRLTLYDVVKSSVEILSKLRFIYLLSLLEAFGKEYIANRDGIPLEGVTRALSSQQSRWRTTQDGVISSTSFLNLAYLRFVLQDKYALDFSSVRKPCFWEAGVLRNCLVHYGGVIPNEAFRAGLTACITETKAANSVGTQISVTDDLMWIFITETRTVLSACDY